MLVFGLSGQVGDALRARLSGSSPTVLAVSRQARVPERGIEWITGSLEAMPVLPEGLDVVVSLGPIDAFADWFAAAAPAGLRVVALGSTGRVDKRESSDPAERALAERLQVAETTLFEAARLRDAAVTVLRPTLLYGNGRDRSLSPLIALARRWRVVPLPWSAQGRRQPVHVDDVAGAVLACMHKPATAGKAYDLPGGETLPFDAMLGRALAAHAPGARVLRLPGPLFALVRSLAGRAGIGGGSAGALDRVARDQLADPTAAHAEFGWAPRHFVP